MEKDLRRIRVLLEEIKGLLEELNGYAREEADNGYHWSGTAIYSGDKEWKENGK